MNWKIFGTFLMVLTLVTSVALGQGTAPTILEGNYISNVFGQSNFIKNPNAKLNTKDVTVSSATVSRSPTTALVATSEFNVAVTSANGTITWATRSFDAGMKNQNCEARFTYRGFQSTSKAHVKQGANTVATLNLSATGSDPRIASINFPCGDLSQPTTFVVTDTAILAGTNEIGGIYVGLATNQANVAQAEFVGSLAWPTNSTNDTRTSVAWDPFQTLGAIDPTPVGSVTSPNRAPRVTVPNLKPGNYRITFVGNFFCFSATQIDAFCAYRITDGTTQYGTQQAIRSYGAISTNQGQATNVIEFDFQYTGATTSKTFQLETRVNNAATNSRVENAIDLGALQISVYRFPTSSELVVTPERQNVWGGVVYTGQNQSLFNTSAPGSTRLPFNNATWNQPTLLKGKAAVTTTNSGNDLGFSIPNLPVGKYKVEISGLINAGNFNSTTAGAYTWCNFFIKETTTSVDVAKQVHQDMSFSTNSTDETRDYTNSFSGVFDNTSVGTRNFILEAMKFTDTTGGNSGICQAYSNTSASSYNTNITFLLTPLDQPSNSALYVQGPVKAAATGDAIPAGYLGKSEFGGDENAATITNGVTTTLATYSNITPGVYLVRFYGAAQPASPTRADYAFWSCSLSTNSAETVNWYDVVNAPSTKIGQGAYVSGSKDLIQHSMNLRLISITATSTYYIRCQASTNNSGIQIRTGTEWIRLN